MRGRWIHSGLRSKGEPSSSGEQIGMDKEANPPEVADAYKTERYKAYESTEPKFKEPNTAWMKKGSCTGLPGEIFFPMRGESINAKMAKEICADCVVTCECDAYLQVLPLRDQDGSGIMGGLSGADPRKK